MAAIAPSISLAHLLLRRSPAASSLNSTFVSFFSSPLSSSVSSNHKRGVCPTNFHIPFNSLSRSNSSLPNSHSLLASETTDEERDDNFVDEADNNNRDEEKTAESSGNRAANAKLPSLTVKEREALASYAHGLGKKLKCQLVGKSGVTSNVAASFIETLEANELLKIKIHNTCPGELREVVQQLQEATGSVVVGQIGRTVIIYRPSLSKMKAEEEKKMKATRRTFPLKGKPKPFVGDGYGKSAPAKRFSSAGRRPAKV